MFQGLFSTKKLNSIIKKIFKTQLSSTVKKDKQEAKIDGQAI